MKEAIVSRTLKSNYERYYDEGISQWRWLGAIDKAKNIISLCADYPHGSILEIGAGEGSILRRLSELDFGERLYAIEISSTGIETITNRNIPKRYSGNNRPVTALVSKYN